MSIDSRLDFSAVEWTPSPGGGRSKVISRGGRQFRIVEISRDSHSAEVCLIGHIGYVVEGEMLIEFDGDSTIVKSGDGVVIPDGLPHTPIPITETVRLFLSEEIDRASS